MNEYPPPDSGILEESGYPEIVGRDIGVCEVTGVGEDPRQGYGGIIRGDLHPLLHKEGPEEGGVRP